jgi:hypothetical protein
VNLLVNLDTLLLIQPIDGVYESVIVLIRNRGGTNFDRRYQSSLIAHDRNLFFRLFRTEGPALQQFDGEQAQQSSWPSTVTDEGTPSEVKRDRGLGFSTYAGNLT